MGTFRGLAAWGSGTRCCHVKDSEGLHLLWDKLDTHPAQPVGRLAMSVKTGLAVTARGAVLAPGGRGPAVLQL